MKLLPLILALSVCGCTCMPKTIEVKVPTPVPCIDTVPEKPNMPLQAADPKEDIFSHSKKAIAEIEVRKGYEKELEAVISACKK